MDLVLRHDIRNLNATELVQAVTAGSVILKHSMFIPSVEVSEEIKTTITALEARAHLGKFGLIKQMVSRPVGSLSTGERTRVYLSLLMLEFAFGEKKGTTPELLVLDEISDNLDIWKLTNYYLINVWLYFCLWYQGKPDDLVHLIVMLDNQKVKIICILSRTYTFNMKPVLETCIMHTYINGIF